MSIDQGSIDQLRIDRSGPSPKSARTAIIGAIVILAVGAGWFFWKGRRPAAEVQTATAVEVAKGADQTVLNASGYVTARRQATVSSKVTGQIIEVLFEEGQSAQSNQVLARIDPSNIKTSVELARSQLDVAQSSLGETEAQLVQASSEYERVAALTSNNVSSVSDLDKARSDADTLKARLARQQVEIVVAQRQLATFEQQLDDTVIRAPFAGVIVSKTAQPGEIISPLSAGGGFTRTGVCTLVDMASLEIEVDVNENYINRVLPGQRVEAVLDAYPDWKIPAKVIAIIPTADRQKGTVKVRISFDRLDQRILPDMGVKVSFESEAAADAPTGGGGAMVPATALRSDAGQDIVLVVRDGHVERRAVKTGLRRDDAVTVLASLAAGEKVVIDGPPNLKDGDAVHEKFP